MSGYRTIEGSGAPIKAWTRGVPVEEAAKRQLENVARLPFIHHHVAVMPDVRWGLGATVGAVIPCRGAVVPAAVGVDIGCGMMAVRTSLTSQQLPESLAALRAASRPAVPHGRTGKVRVANDRGAWRDPSPEVVHAWKTYEHDGVSLEHGPEGDHRQTPKAGERHRAAAPRHARHRQPLRRAVPGRGRPLVGDAALRLARHRQSHRHLVHRAGEGRGGAARRRSARPRPRVAAGGHRAVRRLRRGGRLGPGVRARQPRTDDGDALRCAPTHSPSSPSTRWWSIATTTTWRPSNTSARVSG